MHPRRRDALPSAAAIRATPGVRRGADACCRSRSGAHAAARSQVRDELVAWVKTLVSAAVYATLIVTFGFQVARVEGQSMAPTLADQDRLIVNKLAYRLARSAPRRHRDALLPDQPGEVVRQAGHRRRERRRPHRGRHAST